MVTVTAPALLSADVPVDIVIVPDDAVFVPPDVKETSPLAPPSLLESRIEDPMVNSPDLVFPIPVTISIFPPTSWVDFPPSILILPPTLEEALDKPPTISMPPPVSEVDAPADNDIFPPSLSALDSPTFNWIEPPVFELSLVSKTILPPSFADADVTSVMLPVFLLAADVVPDAISTLPL